MISRPSKSADPSSSLPPLAVTGSHSDSVNATQAVCHTTGRTVRFLLPDSNISSAPTIHTGTTQDAAASPGSFDVEAPSPPHVDLEGIRITLDEDDDADASALNTVSADIAMYSPGHVDNGVIPPTATSVPQDSINVSGVPQGVASLISWLWKECKSDIERSILCKLAALEKLWAPVSVSFSPPDQCNF